MCRWVVGRGYTVPTAPDDLAVADDDRAERAAFIAPHVLSRQPNGCAHEFGMVHIVSIKTMTADKMRASRGFANCGC